MYPRDYRKARIVWLSASAAFCIMFTEPAPSAQGRGSDALVRAGSASSALPNAALSGAEGFAPEDATAAPASGAADDAVDPTKKLADLQAALKAISATLPQAQKDEATARTLLRALPTGSPSLTTDSVEAIRRAQQALVSKTLLPGGKSLTDLNTRLQADLDATKTDGLQGQTAALQSAYEGGARLDADKIADAAVRQTFNAALAQAKTLLAQANPTLDSIKANILPDANSSLINRVKGVNDYAEQLVALLEKAYKDSGVTALGPDADPNTARATLASGLRGLILAEKTRAAFLPVWKDTAAALAAVTDLTKTDVQDTLDALTSAVTDSDKGLLNRLPSEFDVMCKAATDEMDTLHARTDDLSKTLDARERDTPIVTKAAAARAEVSQQVYDFNNITAAAPALFAFWKSVGLKADGAEKSFAALREASDRLSIQAGVLDSLIAGDADHFAQDQVRLFYFTDVPRVIQAINPNAKLITDSRVEAAQLRKSSTNTDLLNEEKQIAALTEEVGRHQDRVRGLQEAIRQASAQRADANNRQQQAQARQKALTRQAGAVMNQTKDLAAQRTVLVNLNKTLTNQIAGTDQITGIDKQAAALTAQNQGLQDNDPQKAVNTQKIADLQTLKTQKQQQIDANAAKINDIDLQIAALPTGTTAQQDATDAAADANAAVTTIQGQISQFNDQLTQLTPKLAAAKQDLIDAQVRRAAARREAALLAQAETEAFGEARDNQPFWYAPSEGILSNDPARRVILSGYADSSVINIRGLPRDVERVKEIIATFDRPAPQSRITLYTLQINGANTQRLNNALKTVDDTLRDARAAIVLVQDKFRDSVNREVERCAEKARHGFNSARPEDRERLKRYTYYAPEISRALGFPGEDSTYADYASVAHLTRWTLPDPADATTLGEAMFIFSLGRYDSRLRMLGRFISETYKQYTVLDRNRGANNQPSHYISLDGTRNFLYAIRPVLEDPYNAGTLYKPFVTALGDDSDTLKTLRQFIAQYKEIPNPNPGGPSGGYPHFFVTILGSVEKGAEENGASHEMTANQLEILKALQTKSRQAVSAEINYLLREIDRLPVSERFGVNTVGDMYREQYFPLIGWLSSKFATPYEDRKDGADKPYSANSLPVDRSIESWRAQGLNALRLIKPGGSAAPGNADYLQADFHAHSIAHVVQERAALSQATARVAAADDMIKRMIIVIEDDLDYFFISPALENLRQQINKQGIEFGTLQRESILATNRLIARVDPRATAMANLANGTDVLDQAQQLGQIAAQFRESQRSAKLNATLPAFGAGISAVTQGHAGTALAYGGLLSLLGDLAASPQAPQGELFSINSGSKFQITPIFDPSGQAMRFKFDYVAQTLVQAPDGSVTPDPSRVDRHTVNTEVQLTNLEVREISRFESNARLGTPAVRSGGLFPLNQIPLLRDIPILGYYYRRNASAATRQESVIFAQTSLYPTISDIMNLLTDVPLRSELNSSTPRYLQGDPLLELAGVEAKRDDAAPDSKARVTVTLTAPAPPGGVKVSLSVSDDKEENSFVEVPAGEKTRSASIPIHTDTPHTLYVTAFYGSIAKKAELSLTPALAPADVAPVVKFDKAAVAGGGDVTGTVTFASPPKAAGMINLGSDRDALYFDKAQMPFPAGATSFQFTAHTRPSAKAAQIHVSANAAGKTFASGTLSVNPPSLKSFYVASDGKNSTQVVLVLDGPAPAAMEACATFQGAARTARFSDAFKPGQTTLAFPLPDDFLSPSAKTSQRVKIFVRVGTSTSAKFAFFTIPPPANAAPRHAAPKTNPKTKRKKS